MCVDARFALARFARLARLGAAFARLFALAAGRERALVCRRSCSRTRNTQAKRSSGGGVERRLHAPRFFSKRRRRRRRCRRCERVSSRRRQRRWQGAREQKFLAATSCRRSSMATSRTSARSACHRRHCAPGQRVTRVDAAAAAAAEARERLTAARFVARQRLLLRRSLASSQLRKTLALVGARRVLSGDVCAERSS